MALLLLTLAMTAAHLTAQVFTTLHSFTGGSDGANPYAGLILSGNTLYGTAVQGTSFGYGTVFKVNTDGTGFKVLETFNGVNNEAYPETSLLLSGSTLYGASGGPGTTVGTLFAVNTNGTGFMTLRIFTALTGAHYTNSDGGEVWGPLILSGNTLYGTAQFGSSGGMGMVFAVNTNGTGLTTLHSFAALSVPFDPFGSFNPPYTNSDGAASTSGLILSGNTLYGTTYEGGSGRGSSGKGTVFAVNTNGTGFTVLHSFTGSSDGANPYGGLILSGNTLYGMANVGGSRGMGTVFAVNTDGTGFTNLHNFNGSRDGANPYGGLILSGNTLYGTAYGGGSSGNGTVFSLSFPPQLTIIPSETNLILTWPTNYAGFDYTGYTLESTTNLVSPVWATNSPAPVVVNGQNVVTNTISGTQQFYRLIQ